LKIMVEEKKQQLFWLYCQLIPFYKEMLSISNSQKELIEIIDFTVKEDLAKLNHFLMSRQEQMKQIDEIQKEINSLKYFLTNALDLPEFKYSILEDFYPTEDAAQFQKVLTDLEELLKEIAVVDTGIQQMLQIKRNHVKDKIKNIQKGKQAKNSYNPVKQQSEGFFIDINKNTW